MTWKRWFPSRHERKADVELKRYIVHLEQLDDEAMSGVLTNSLLAVKRLTDLASPYNDVLIALRSGGCRSDLAALALSEIIQGLANRDSLRAAASYAPWFHTLRAYNYPRLRKPAGAMWRQLKRGEPGLHKHLEPKELFELLPYLEWSAG